MKFRAFDQWVEDKAQECRANPFTAEDFGVMDPARQGGGTGAIKVVMHSSGRTAWAKPEGVGNALIRDVAHERIGSELGFALALPVAPVAMSLKTVGKPLHRIVALSYEVLSAGRMLNQLPPDARAKLDPTLSAMFVYLAWINDHDHFGGSNAHFETVNGEPRVAFFDFGHSLTKGWALPGPAPNRNEWRNPPALFAPLNLAAANEILQHIEGFPVNELQRIINEVPNDCLPADAKNHLVQALDQRRKDLRGILNI